MKTLFVILYLVIGAVAAYFLLRKTDEEGEAHLALGIILFWPLLVIVWLLLQAGRIATALTEWVSNRW